MQNGLGAGVVCVAEGGQEDDLVADVKIGVARWEAFVLENDRRRHRQLNDAQGGFAQALAVRLERGVVFVFGIFLDGGDDGLLIHKSAWFCSKNN